MGDLRISDVVETTRLSARYWQRRAAMGEIPGVASKFSLIIQRGFVFLDVPFARFAPFAMDKTWDEALSRAPLWRSSLAPSFHFNRAAVSQLDCFKLPRPCVPEPQ